MIFLDRDRTIVESDVVIAPGVMIYPGNTLHEVECRTAEDTAIYLEAFGGEFNYSKRPVIVTIGANSVAASLQGQPHGEDTVAANDMDGHACLYFSSSTSHVASLPDVEHQAQVYKAAGRN